MLDTTTLELSLLVSDRQVAAIQIGDVARVRIDPLGNRLVEGMVVRKGRAPQDATQRYPVVIALANEQGAMFPGMLAHARLEMGRAPAIRLPERALIREFELDYVFAIDTEGRARRLRVATRPVPFRPDQVEVQAGLEEGQRVAVSGVSQLREGLPVEATPVAQP